jgi:hypothetical protein
LVDQIAVRAVQLDRVETQALRIGGSSCESCDRIGNFSFGQRLADLFPGLAYPGWAVEFPRQSFSWD